MKLIKIFLILLILNFTDSFAESSNEFNQWKLNFKKIALANDISEITIDTTISNVKYAFI